MTSSRHLKKDFPNNLFFKKGFTQMKKLFSVILIILLSLTLVACGESCGDGVSDGDGDGDVDFPLVEWQPK